MRHSSCTSIITGAAIPASPMDGKISTAGSFRAMCRQYRRAHTVPFFLALAASRPPADRNKLRAENARLRTSLTTVLASSKIRSRRRSKRQDRGARIALCDLQFALCAQCRQVGNPLSGLWSTEHRMQHILMPPKKIRVIILRFEARTYQHHKTRRKMQ
jgi:hypothetical protein